MNLGTADPQVAQAHARAQVGTRAKTMPTAPVTRAVNLPPGVAPRDVVRAKTIALSDYAGRQIAPPLAPERPD